MVSGSFWPNESHSNDSQLIFQPDLESSSHSLINMLTPAYQLLAYDQLAPALDHLQVIADQTFELSILVFLSLSRLSETLYIDYYRTAVATAVLCSLRKATERIAEHSAR